MEATHRNLLTEPLITAAERDGERNHLTLPEVLATLGAAGVIEFAMLQPHQRHAWHAFLVQLAVIALSGGGQVDPEQDADTWQRWLRSLTHNDDAPWCLMVDDLSKPAFMQAPIPEGSLDGFKRIARTPDAIDVLITAKNHDLKQQRMSRAAPEHWIFSLVTAQTMNGFSGRGQYGIARMNGGFSSRPCVATVPDMSWGARFRRDVSLWQAHRSTLVGGESGYPAVGGVALLWLPPWDGESSLTLPDCDALVIEICRRIRLVSDGGSIRARLSSSSAPRIEARKLGGNTGDLWTPMKIDSTSLSVSGRGFSYDLMRQLIVPGEFQPSKAQEIDPSVPGNRVVVAEALARGQGTTDGWHHRLLPLPGHVVTFFGSAEGAQLLATMAQQRVDDVTEVRRRLLHPALCVVVQGAPESLNLRDDRTGQWTRRLDAEVDRIFFERLWVDIDRDTNEAAADWRRRVIDIASDILEDAVKSSPMPSVRRYRVISTAESVFWGSARKRFPDVFDRNKQEGANKVIQTDSEAAASVTPRYVRLRTAINAIAGDIAGRLPTGDVAELRRLRPDDPGNPAFWRMVVGRLEPAELLPDDGPLRDEVEQQWAVILSGMANMSGLHRPGSRLGTALALADVAEQRFIRLLRAHDDALFDTVRVTVHQLASRAQAIDWAELAELVLSDNRSNEDQVRRRVARDYYRVSRAE